MNSLNLSLEEVARRGPGPRLSFLHDVASRSSSLHIARLHSNVRADLNVAADRSKGTVRAVQDSFGVTCRGDLLVDWEAKIVSGHAPVTGKSVVTNFKFTFAAAACGAAR